MPVNSGYNTSVALINSTKDELYVLLAQYDESFNLYKEIFKSKNTALNTLLANKLSAENFYEDKRLNYTNTDRQSVTAAAELEMNAARTAYDTALAEQTAKIDTPRLALEELFATIMEKSKIIYKLVEDIKPKEVSNRSSIDATIGNIRTKLAELNVQKSKLELKDGNLTPAQKEAALLKLEADELELDGQYTTTSINTESKFSKYILYLILLIFVVSCLFYIYMVPKSGNLDMFMLALGIIIIGYYIYDYVVKKMRARS
jgi:hypothetical protein